MLVVLSYSGILLNIIVILIRFEKQAKNTEKNISREAKIQTSSSQLYSSFILTLAQNITGKNV